LLNSFFDFFIEFQELNSIEHNKLALYVYMLRQFIKSFRQGKPPISHQAIKSYKPYTLLFNIFF